MNNDLSSAPADADWADDLNTATTGQWVWVNNLGYYWAAQVRRGRKNLRVDFDSGSMLFPMTTGHADQLASDDQVAGRSMWSVLTPAGRERLDARNALIARLRAHGLVPSRLSYERMAEIVDLLDEKFGVPEVK